MITEIDKFKITAIHPMNDKSILCVGKLSDNNTDFDLKGYFIVLKILGGSAEKEIKKTEVFKGMSDFNNEYVETGLLVSLEKDLDYIDFKCFKIENLGLKQIVKKD